MKQVVSITLGQLNQFKGNPSKWMDYVWFNAREVTMIGDTNLTYFVSIEERETLIEDYQWLKNRPIIDYNPIEEEI